MERSEGRCYLYGDTWVGVFKLLFCSTIKKKEHKLYGAHSGPVGGLPMKKAVKITFDSDDE